MWWLARAPQLVMMRAFDHMAKLEAEESMLTTNRIAMGTGSLEKDDARRLSDTWARAANDGRRPMKRASPAALAGAGIGVRKVAKG